jgi:hypothetical protein
MDIRIAQEQNIQKVEMSKEIELDSSAQSLTDQESQFFPVYENEETATTDSNTNNCKHSGSRENNTTLITNQTTESRTLPLDSVYEEVKLMSANQFVSEKTFDRLSSGHDIEELEVVDEPTGIHSSFQKDAPAMPTSLNQKECSEENLIQEPPKNELVMIRDDIAVHKNFEITDSESNEKECVEEEKNYTENHTQIVHGHEHEPQIVEDYMKEDILIEEVSEPVEDTIQRTSLESLCFSIDENNDTNDGDLSDSVESHITQMESEFPQNKYQQTLGVQQVQVSVKPRHSHIQSRPKSRISLISPETLITNNFTVVNEKISLDVPQYDEESKTEIQDIETSIEAIIEHYEEPMCSGVQDSPNVKVDYHLNNLGYYDEAKPLESNVNSRTESPKPLVPEEHVYSGNFKESDAPGSDVEEKSTSEHRQVLNEQITVNLEEILHDSLETNSTEKLMNCEDIPEPEYVQQLPADTGDKLKGAVKELHVSQLT